MLQVVQIHTPGRQEYLQFAYKYHWCWWLSDTRSQGISRHDIDLIAQNNPGPSTVRVKSSEWSRYIVCFMYKMHGSIALPLELSLLLTLFMLNSYVKKWSFTFLFISQCYDRWHKELKSFVMEYSSIHLSCLTLNVREPSLLGFTGSISWLLMPWLLASPGHQQPWYWLYRIDRSLSYSRRNVNYLCLISVEEWQKM